MALIAGWDVWASKTIDPWGQTLRIDLVLGGHPSATDVLICPTDVEGPFQEMVRKRLPRKAWKTKLSADLLRGDSPMIVAVAIRDQDVRVVWRSLAVALTLARVTRGRTLFLPLDCLGTKKRTITKGAELVLEVLLDWHPETFEQVYLSASTTDDASKVAAAWAPTPKLKVFLCHGSDDKPRVRGIYERLLVDGFRPWLDSEDLHPGQDWKAAIEDAVRTSDIVLVCLTQNSTTKTGFVQKEIKFALDRADEQPEGKTYVIPALLEPCAVPERLKRWQWVGLHEPEGYERLARTLRSIATEASRA